VLVTVPVWPAETLEQAGRSSTPGVMAVPRGHGSLGGEPARQLQYVDLATFSVCDPDRRAAAGAVLNPSGSIALLVDRLAGLRRDGDLSGQDAEQSPRPGFAGMRWRDSSGQVWQEIELAALAADGRSRDRRVTALREGGSQGLSGAGRQRTRMGYGTFRQGPGQQWRRDSQVSPFDEMLVAKAITPARTILA
jgi:hypothetical protein